MTKIVTMKSVAETMEIVLISFAARAVTSTGSMMSDDVTKTALTRNVIGMEMIVMSMFALKNVCMIELVMDIVMKVV